MPRQDPGAVEDLAATCSRVAAAGGRSSPTALRGDRAPLTGCWAGLAAVGLRRRAGAAVAALLARIGGPVRVAAGLLPVARREIRPMPGSRWQRCVGSTTTSCWCTARPPRLPGRRWAPGRRSAGARGSRRGAERRRPRGRAGPAPGGARAGGGRCDRDGSKHPVGRRGRTGGRWHRGRAGRGGRDGGRGGVGEETQLGRRSCPMLAAAAGRRRVGRPARSDRATEAGACVVAAAHHGRAAPAGRPSRPAALGAADGVPLAVRAAANELRLRTRHRPPAAGSGRRSRPAGRGCSAPASRWPTPWATPVLSETRSPAAGCPRRCSSTGRPRSAARVARRSRSATWTGPTTWPCWCPGSGRPCGATVRGLTADGGAGGRPGPGRRRPSEATATIAWTAYDAPSLLQRRRPTPRPVTGAPLLASDLRGLDALRAVMPPHLTAVGHSYGSTTVGTALRDHRPGWTTSCCSAAPGPTWSARPTLGLPARPRLGRGRPAATRSATWTGSAPTRRTRASVRSASGAEDVARHPVDARPRPTTRATTRRAASRSTTSCRSSSGTARTSAGRRTAASCPGCRTASRLDPEADRRPAGRGP